MNPSQNVLKISTVSPDTSEGTAAALTDGYNNNRMFHFQLHYSIRLTVCCLRGTVVECRSLTGELLLSCAQPAADG